MVSHIGTVHLETGLTLTKVLCVPKFKHNLLSVQRLVKESNCQVEFHPTHCLILDALTKKIKGVGKAQNGLYYLMNHVTEHLPAEWIAAHKSKSFNCQATNIVKEATESDNTLSLSDPYSLWHHRLGHAPFTKLRYIDAIQPLQ